MRVPPLAGLLSAFLLLGIAATPAPAQEVHAPGYADGRTDQLAPPPSAAPDLARDADDAPYPGAAADLPEPSLDARIGGSLSPETSGAVVPPGPREGAIDGPRARTGGAQTLDDILARQNGNPPDAEFRSEALGDPNSAAAIAAQLGTLGGRSDAEIWRGVRYDKIDMIASNRGPAADVLIQTTGMNWLHWREGPVAHYGGYAILGTIGLLALFYLIRGRIRIDGGRVGIMVPRFSAIERFGHWLVAGSFVTLALTGLWTLFGRLALIDLMGKEAYAPIAQGAKWIHNNIAWAFMLGLAWVFIAWVLHNIPRWHDLVWLRQGGGIVWRDKHPPAGKFNAGQKLIFWGVIALGVSISVSGLSLLFPFEMPMFGWTFAKLNALGVSDLLGLGHLPEVMTPQAEMQFSQIWHLIVGLGFICLIIAHIYIGTLGMEGAFDAMGEGDVDARWAKEHHSIWYEQLRAEGKAPPVKLAHEEHGR